MRFQFNRLALTLLVVSTAAIGFITARAQQPDASAQYGPPDPRWIKQIEAILNQKFTRDPSELLRNLERFGTADPKTLIVTDRFNLRFLTGDWGKVREELAQMPPDLARKIYDKMLADLTERQKPNMQLEDVLGLADAVPGEFTGDNLHKLGQCSAPPCPRAKAFGLPIVCKKARTRSAAAIPPGAC